jgi:hypothetical protein
MPSFLRVFRRDADAKAKKNALAAAAALPAKPKWEEAWSLKEVQPKEVQELIRVCTQEMKSRGIYPVRLVDCANSASSRDALPPPPLQTRPGHAGLQELCPTVCPRPL